MPCVWHCKHNAMCTNYSIQKVSDSTYTADNSHAMCKVTCALVPVRRMRIADLLNFVSKLSVYTACRDYIQPDMSGSPPLDLLL